MLGFVWLMKIPTLTTDPAPSLLLGNQMLQSQQQGGSFWSSYRLIWWNMQPRYLQQHWLWCCIHSSKISNQGVMIGAPGNRRRSWKTEICSFCSWAVSLAGAWRLVELSQINQADKNDETAFITTACWSIKIIAVFRWFVPRNQVSRSNGIPWWLQTGPDKKSVLLPVEIYQTLGIQCLLMILKCSVTVKTCSFHWTWSW